MNTTSRPGPVSEGLPASVPIDKIELWEGNPRKRFDEARLAGLAASIAEHGLLNPITVRPGPSDNWQVVAGERRFRACQAAGMTTVPCIVREVDDHHALILAITENDDREDVSVVERARAYVRLQVDGMSIEEIAKTVGKAAPTVSNAIRLLDLPRPAMELLEAGELGPSQARAIVGLTKVSPKAVTLLANLAVEHNASAHALESCIPSEIAHSLTKAGVAVPVDTYRAPFSMVCKTCPFGAYRASYYGALCFRPEHYTELLAEQRAEAERQKAAISAEIKERKEAAKLASKAHSAVSPDLSEQAPKLVDIGALGYAEFVDLEYADPPPGCTAECSCRVKAIRHGQTIEACLMPGRFRSLKANVTRAKTNPVAEIARDLTFEVDNYPAYRYDRRALAVICWTALEDAVRETGPYPGIPEAVAKLRKSYKPDVTALALLRDMDPDALLNATVRLIARREIATAIRANSDAMVLTRWLINAAEEHAPTCADGVPEPEPTAPSADDWEGPACRSCGVARAGNGSEYCVDCDPLRLIEAHEGAAI